MPKTATSAENLSAPFVFVQSNFWDGRLYYPIRNFFNREQPDICSLQEVLSGPVDAAPSYFTVEGLLEKGHFDQVVRGNSRPRISLKNNVFNIMCATFLKNPLRCISTTRVVLDESETGTPDVYYSLLHSHVELADGSLVHILNHHAKLVFEGRMGTPLTDGVFRKIADYAAKLSGPIILSGDFNLDKAAAPLQHLKEIGLVNLNDVYGITKARNEFSWQPDEAVSHIFINDQVVVEEYSVPQDNMSDHLPLRLKCRVVT